MPYGPYTTEIGEYLGEYIGDDFIGESNAGMQHTANLGADDFIGAARALSRLKGSLGQAAQHRFAKHAPISKVLRSPYKDSTQIGLTTDPGITVFNGANAQASQGTAVTRVYKSFKPNKAVVNVSIQYTYTPSGSAVEASVFYTPPSNGDVLLVSAFSGADNCFPNAPSASTGINCTTFSNNALGVGISWPTLNGGIDMTVGFLVRPSILGYFYTAFPTLSTDATLVKAVVTIDMSLLGPSLR